MSIAAAAALTLGLASTAWAAPLTEIKAQHSGKVLDIEGIGMQDGARLITWDDWGGENQRFFIKIAGDGSYYIVAEHSNKCLDVSGVSMDDGAPLQQWNCYGGENQRFYLIKLADGSFLIVAKHSGKCLDVWGGGTANGTPVVQWRCHGGGNQRFTMSGFGAGAPADDEVDELSAEPGPDEP